MALVAALIIAGIAIGLLVVYGADVAVGYSNEDGQGFLPFDHMTRGIGLGLPSLILPIIAFVITRREPSSILGIMIISAGILILVGGAVVIGNADSTQERNAMAETMPLVVVGIIQVILGAIKIKKSR